MRESTKKIIHKEFKSVQSALKSKRDMIDDTKIIELQTIEDSFNKIHGEYLETMRSIEIDAEQEFLIEVEKYCKTVVSDTNKV